MPSTWWHRIAASCTVLAVLAWLLMIFRYQYGAVSLQAYNEITLDWIFLAAIGGAAMARALDRRAPADRRLFLFRLILFVGATVFSVIAAEYAARLVYRRAQTSGNAREFTARSSAWSPGPSNALGFREREITRKAPGRYRIAVVGDSFTWGAGIERDERFSNVLEASLGPRYEVLNFGIPGNNMREHLAVINRALEVSPDFVLLQLYINDFETRQMQRPRSYPLLPGALDGELRQSSLLYVLLGLIVVYMVRQQIVRTPTSTSESDH